MTPFTRIPGSRPVDALPSSRTTTSTRRVCGSMTPCTSSTRPSTACASLNTDVIATGMPACTLPARSGSTPSTICTAPRSESCSTAPPWSRRSPTLAVISVTTASAGDNIHWVALPAPTSSCAFSACEFNRGCSLLIAQQRRRASGEFEELLAAVHFLSKAHHQLRHLPRTRHDDMNSAAGVGKNRAIRRHPDRQRFLRQRRGLDEDGAAFGGATAIVGERRVKRGPMYSQRHNHGPQKFSVHCRPLVLVDGPGRQLAADQRLQGNVLLQDRLPKLDYLDVLREDTGAQVGIAELVEIARLERGIRIRRGRVEIGQCGIRLPQLALQQRLVQQDDFDIPGGE